jgi:hypothetical protein
MARPKGRQLPNRVSVALTDDQVTALEGIAQENQAAVAWVVRRAVVEFLDRNRLQVVTGDGRTGHSPAESQNKTTEQAPQGAIEQVRRAG